MAIPLLFCHGLPGGIVEASKIIDLLTEPSEEGMQAFHVVVPSVPGCGFSDHFKLEDPGMGEVARVFDTLMSTLGYEHYVAHGSDWGFGVCRMLATHHSSTCLAVHTTTPIPYLERPSFTWRLWNYLGFLIARFTRANVPGLRFGYHHSDFLPRTPRRPNLQSPGGSISGRGFSPGPQALAYGMCDSPVGLLAWIRHAQYERTKMVEAFSSAETIDFTMMSWLPGPEAPLRFMYGAPTTSELRDITWYASGLNRITGTILSGGLYVFATAYLAAPLFGWHLDSASIAAAVATWPVAAKVLAKFSLAMPFTFHCFNGLRYLSWDTGSTFANKQVIRTGWIVVGATVVSSGILAYL
ncbi:MAG: hypothetical protein M1838_004736 [Thelocarpon superellum]|nr:MAG: hypothetical protein M1838_004736 [Thelocarpon superellum]